MTGKAMGDKELQARGMADQGTSSSASPTSAPGLRKIGSDLVSCRRDRTCRHKFADLPRLSPIGKGDGADIQNLQTERGGGASYANRR